MNTLIQDLRYGLRVLRKGKGFTIVAVIALALGIGANTAIFSVVNKVLLQPLPYANADQLLMIRETNVPKFPEFSIAPGNFIDWQKQSTVFSSMAAYRGQAYILVGGSEPERVRATRITSGLFGMLGAAPILGRDFTPEEDQDGKGNVVILSNGFWQRRFGGDKNAVGQSLTLSGQPFSIVGIMPATFKFPDPTIDLWAPIAFTARDAQNHGGHYISAIARLKPGASVDQARSELDTIAGRLSQQYPDSNTGWGVKVVPLQDYIVNDVKPALYILLGAVLLVLLIACANVANLLLVRASSRQKEISLRAALGASRWRVARQLLTESVLLAVIGGVVGLGVAYWGLSLLLQLAPEGLPRIQDVSIDGRALVFTLVVTVITGVVFGLVPALQASRPNLNETLKEGGRGGTEGTRRQRLRSTLVVVEIALSLVLLVCAGLLIKSFVRLLGVDPGFNPQHVLVTGIGLSPTKYRDDAQKGAFFNQLLAGLSSVPGVQAAGVTQALPISGDYVLSFIVQGRPAYKPGEGPSTNYYSVSADYFKAMGIPLLRGRLFNDRDVQGAPRVAIINDAMAKKFFADEDPLGKRIHVSNGPETFREIVGVVGDVRQYGLDQAATVQTYEPQMQAPFGGMTVVVRTAGEPTSLSAAVRDQVRAIDKDQPVSTMRTMEEIVSTSVASRRFSMLLLGVFAGLALVLAAVGIYGVMAYSVSQRTHEIGIRLALGARRGDVVRLVLGQGMAVAGIGVAVGVVAAFAATRLLSTLVYGVSLTDPVIFVSIPLILGAVALVACLLPARRATMVDPLVALRYE
ncbi:MAG: ABC transporter permease [Acidobacteriota bacterium]